MPNKNKALGSSLERRIVERAKAKGLTASKQPGSGVFRDFPHDAVIGGSILTEAKVRSVQMDAKGVNKLSVPIDALRAVQAAALVNNFEQGVLVVNPKGSHSPLAVMDLDWFLSILAKALDVS